MLLLFYLIFILCLLTLAYSSSVSGDESGRTKRIYKVFLALLLVADIFVTIDLLVRKEFENAIFCALFIPLPLFLTCINVVHFIQQRSQKTVLTDLMSIVIGGVLWVLLVEFSMDILLIPWYEPAYRDFYHEYLNTEYRGNIAVLLFSGLVGFAVLSAVRSDKLPPLVSALLTSFITVGLVLFTLVNVQLAKNFQPIHIMLWVYVLNLFLIAARRIRINVIAQVRKVRERQTQFRTKFGAWLYKMMSRTSGMTALSFLLTLPIILLFEILFIIFGQAPDGFIKAFTETADWTFSQQTPPPPIDYEGHYLCTVAAGGHKSVVRPLRYGIRRGEAIVVNRQLLIANAFEDMIQERCPRFHRAVRSFYDKHGYPLSKLITTKLRADIVYILMKPLEILFITALYLFDIHPENRIAVQYSDYKRRIG